MTKIQAELRRSKKYMLEIIKKTNLVALTRANVARVEAMIQNDSAYRDTSSDNSTKSCMLKLKEYIDSEQNDKKSYNKIIKNAVEAIDRDNSTHLNADNVGRDEITNRICSLSLEDLTDYLQRPHDTKYKLFEIIAEKTHPKDKKYKPRTNKSFASKFCHKACYYLFEGKETQDNYSMYDSVVKNVLPLYADYYNIDIKEYNLEDYVDYSAIIEKILEMSGNNISKNGFDHLLWYYFKGRNIKNIKTE